jgi:hypothetical protein
MVWTCPHCGYKIPRKFSIEGRQKLSEARKRYWARIHAERQRIEKQGQLQKSQQESTPTTQTTSPTVPQNLMQYRLWQREHTFNKN